MRNTTVRDAAELRRTQTRARADRPSERRSDSQAGSLAVVRAALTNVTVREAGDDTGGLVEFRGVASVTEHAYEMWDWAGPYNEILSVGAFTDSLNRADLDVPLVIGHDQIRRIARTTNGTLDLSEDGGLVTVARLDPADRDVDYIVPKLRAGLIDEMSFAFRITRGQWSPDYTEYRIDAVDIHRGDVAIVGYGANPATSAGVRSKPAGTSRARFDLDHLMHVPPVPVHP